MGTHTQHRICLVMPPSSSLRARTSLGLRIALGSLLLPLVVAPRDQHSFVNGAKGSCLQRIACDNDGQLRKYRNSLESLLDNTWGEQTGWGAVIAGGGTNQAQGDGAFVGAGGAINKDDLDADWYTVGNNAKGLLSAVIAGSGNVT